MPMALRAGTSNDGYISVNGVDVLKITTTAITPLGTTNTIDFGSTTNYFKNVYGSYGGFTTIQTDSTITAGGNVLPLATNSVDLGSSTLRWRNIYTNDLQLSNGIGDYTIVEGKDDLFLYNNKNGKVYKFLVQEVDPADAPAKAV